MRPVERAAVAVALELDDAARAAEDDAAERGCIELYGEHPHSVWEHWRPYYGPWWPAGRSASEAGAVVGVWSSGAPDARRG